MKRQVESTLLLCFLAACGNANVGAAKKAIESRVADPAGVQYKEVTAYSEGVVCGELNQKNSTGGYDGFKDFIYNGMDEGLLNLDPSPSERSILCNNNAKKRISFLQREVDNRTQNLNPLRRDAEYQAKVMQEWEAKCAAAKATYDKAKPDDRLVASFSGQLTCKSFSEQVEKTATAVSHLKSTYAEIEEFEARIATMQAEFGGSGAPSSKK